VSAEAAPPAPADSTGRTYATSVNLNSIITAVAPPPSANGGGVSATFRALAGRTVCITFSNNICIADIRFSADGTNADYYYRGSWQTNLSPASPGLGAYAITADGILRLDSPNNNGTSQAWMLPTEAVLYGDGRKWVLIGR